MKKILIILLLALPVYITASFYFLDRWFIFPPIDARAGFVVRNDTRGDGAFGVRRNGGRRHEGVDFFAALGTPVYAARSGRVTISRVARDQKAKTGSGNYIAIFHSDGLTSIYAHLTRVFVKYGQFVRQGDCIGTVGKTGNANYPDIQPHLHFELRKGRVALDPMEYLE